MSIGIQNINGTKPRQTVSSTDYTNRISDSKLEHDLKIDKLGSAELDKNVNKPSQGDVKFDTYRDLEHLYIICQLSGVKKENLKIILSYDVLSIEGIQRCPLENKEVIPITGECFWGEFRRRIVLPEDIDTSKLTAEFQDGYLLITIPIIEKAKLRVIEIN